MGQHDMDAFAHFADRGDFRRRAWHAAHSICARTLRITLPRLASLASLAGPGLHDFPVDVDFQRLAVDGSRAPFLDRHAHRKRIGDMGRRDGVGKIAGGRDPAILRRHSLFDW